MPQFPPFRIDWCYKSASVKNSVLFMYTCKQSCSHQISYGADRKNREAFTLCRV